MSFRKFRDKKGNTYSHLYIDEASGIFYAVARKGTRVLKVSLETKDFNEARSKILDALTHIEKRKAKKTHNKLLKEYWIDLVNEKLAEENKDSTMKRMNSVWNKSIEPFWGNLNVEQIDQDKVTEFILWHKENRKGIQFINVFKYLGNLFRFLRVRNHLTIAPDLVVPKTELRHHAKKKGRFATDKELRAILSHLDGQVRLITQIAIATGMRQMEIGRIEINRIKKVEGTLVFALDTDDTKTGLSRDIPIPKSLNASLEALMKPGAQYLFTQLRNTKKVIDSQTIDREWQGAKAKARIEGRLRFHDLRHTCATTMAKQNINPVIACTMLGMSLKTYQKTYLNLSTKDLILASEALFRTFGETHAD